MSGNPVQQVQCLRYGDFRAEFGIEYGAAGLAVSLETSPVFKKAPYGRCEGRWISRWHQVRINALTDHLSQRRYVAGNDRQADSQRLNEGASQALIKGWENEQIRCSHHIGDVVAMTEHEHAFSNSQLVDLGGQGWSFMPFTASNDKARQGMILEKTCERLNQVVVALLVFLASDREDDLMLGKQTQRSSHSCSTVIASIAQPLRIAPPPDNCDSIWGNPKLCDGRVFDGLTDCVKVVGEVPGGEAVEHLGESEPKGGDIGVIDPSFVVGGVDQIGHYWNGQTDGGNSARNVRVVQRRIHKIGPLIDNHAPESETFAQQGAPAQEPDIMSRLQNLLFKADRAPMKTADDRGDMTALELWKEFDQRALGSSRQKRVDDKEVLRALSSLSDSALA